MQIAPEKLNGVGIQSLIESFESNNINLELFQSFIQDMCPPFPKSPKPPLRCAVFKGGGVKVIAYVGVIQALEEKNLIDRLEYIAGSSGGSFFALLLGLGFSGSQIGRGFERFNLSDFTDQRTSAFGSGVASWRLKQLIEILSSGNIYSGENIRIWASNLIEHVLGDANASFEDLHQAKKDNPTLKDVYFLATRLRPKANESQEVVFGFSRDPKIRILDAFCASLALPSVYPPILVRRKDGSAVGYANDGGLVNNFPITIFDHKCFLSPNYAMQFMHYQGLATPHAVNPSTMGFSLVSHLDQLDDSITPFTERLKSLVKQKPEDLGAIEVPHTWGHWDLIRSLIIYKYGRLEAEDSERKYLTHPENSIQIYSEGVDTTDFDLQGEKLELLIESGKQAFLLWHDKYAKPSDDYQGDYHPILALTHEQMVLKQSDPLKFFKEQALAYVETIFDELLTHKKSIDSLHSNVRLQERCYYLMQLLNKRSFDGLSKEAILSDVLQTYLEQKKQRDRKCKMARDHIEKCVDPSLILEKLNREMAQQDLPMVTLELHLKAQVGNLFEMLVISEKALLHTALLSRVESLECLFQMIHDKYTHYYQLGRTCLYTYKELVNQRALRPLLFTANHSPDPKALSICLNQGLDPLVKHHQAKTALHHACDIGNLEAIQCYLDHFAYHKIPLSLLRFGPEQISVWSYIMRYQSENFIFQFINHRGAKDARMIYEAVPCDHRGITPLMETAAFQGVHLWREVVDRFSSKSQDYQFSFHMQERAAKIAEHDRRLESILLQLKSEHYSNLKILDTIPILDLLNLALVSDKTSSIFYDCIVFKYTDFFQAYLDKLCASGFRAEVLALLQQGFQKESFELLARQHQNEDAITLIQKLSLSLNNIALAPKTSASASSCTILAKQEAIPPQIEASSLLIHQPEALLFSRNREVDPRIFNLESTFSEDEQKDRLEKKPF